MNLFALLRRRVGYPWIALGLAAVAVLPTAAAAQSGPEIMQKHRQVNRVKDEEVVSVPLMPIDASVNGADSGSAGGSAAAPSAKTPTSATAASTEPPGSIRAHAALAHMARSCTPEPGGASSRRSPRPWIAMPVRRPGDHGSSSSDPRASSRRGPLDRGSPRAPRCSQSNLGLIQTTAHRAAALTGQLLALSRRQVLQPMVIDLHMVIGNVVPMLRRLIGEDIEIHTVAGATGRVKVDPGQIERVLVNLAVNARDAMPNGGRLVIGVGALGQKVREVLDAPD